MNSVSVWNVNSKQAALLECKLCHYFHKIFYNKRAILHSTYLVDGLNGCIHCSYKLTQCVCKTRVTYFVLSHTNLWCTRKLLPFICFLPYLDRFESFFCLISFIKHSKRAIHQISINLSEVIPLHCVCAHENQKFRCVRKLCAGGIDGGSNCTSIQQKHKQDGKFFSSYNFVRLLFYI